LFNIKFENSDQTTSRGGDSSHVTLSICTATHCNTSRGGDSSHVTRSIRTCIAVCCSALQCIAVPESYPRQIIHMHMRHGVPCKLCRWCVLYVRDCRVRFRRCSTKYVVRRVECICTACPHLPALFLEVPLRLINICICTVALYTYVYA